MFAPAWQQVVHDSEHVISARTVLMNQTLKVGSDEGREEEGKADQTESYILWILLSFCGALLAILIIKLASW
jgi:hypothetical protein